MKRIAIAVMPLLLVAAVAGAAELSKYKDWDKSPEAYFLTDSERSQWAAVATDADAEAFVNAYFDRRGGDAFKTDVAKRIEMADQHLSFAGTKGSRSLRGKVVVLFGPPAKISVQDWEKKHSSGGSNGLPGAAYSNIAAGASPATDSDRGGGGADAASATGAGTGTASLWAMRDYTFSFAGKNVPGMKKDVDVTVEVDLSNGRDRTKSTKAQKELDDLFESVAKASIK